MRNLLGAIGACMAVAGVAVAGLVNVTATDRQDKPVQYAEVVLTNVETRAITRKATDRYGAVNLGWIQSGKYKVSAVYQGKAGEQKEIEVGVSSINVRVKAGAGPSQE